ncbi:hypothetical protein PGQ11_009340 [Apiospora arundinis]|uniref:Heterokaryon incompatibility domain-containing protein n=1 Tax=Apiospora arundinis TaxID=335852 RepID=A0ABR2IIT2_9PEZI
MASQIEVEMSLAELVKAPLSQKDFTRQRFRFIDCRALVHKNTFRLLSFATLPAEQYSAISYVWRGLPPLPAGPDDPPEEKEGWIAVEGALAADPIALRMLATACRASLQLGHRLLWLDGVCIMQHDGADKAWQIGRMHDVYARCGTCLVFPGGLRRLGGLADETPWIHRAWTLQEAVGPRRVECVLAWPWGPDVAPQTYFGIIFQDVEPGTSAMTPLGPLLMGAALGEMQLKRLRGGSTAGLPATVRLDLFGRDTQTISALMRCRNRTNSEESKSAIWNSAILRSASVPVDMVFSIMGLLGVTLDVASFGSEDVHRATVELARALLAKGGRANWMSLSFSVEPDPRMSTFPYFPRVSIDGNTYVETPEGLKKPGDYIFFPVWYLDNALTGSMNEKGYFEFTAAAAPVWPTDQNSWEKAQDQGDPRCVIKTTRDQYWSLTPPPQSQTDARRNPGDSHAGSFCIVIGEQQQWTEGSFPRYAKLEVITVMFVSEHMRGKWHVVGHGEVEPEFVEGWQNRKFVVGGPEA